MFDEIYKRIDQLIVEKNQIIIAIDGQAASGKTTLAHHIKDKYQGDIIHMDDYFLRANQRTFSRLNEVGGNIDYERFEAEVIHHLKDDYIHVTPFNCQTMSFDQSKKIENKKILIIEGAYSMRPSWIPFYDLKILLMIDSNLQVERIKNRNGSKLTTRFLEEWIPKENIHIKTNDLEKISDILIQISK